MIRPVNVAFTILIKIEGRLKEFNFRKRNENLYDVNTNDEYTARYYFQMEREDGKNEWRISGQPLPVWLTGHETAISNALNHKIQT